MQWDKFKDQFHSSWHSKIQKFIESQDCDKIYEFLKFEGRRGKKIAPISLHTYKAFLLTPLDELKVVLMGFCPYHTFINGSPVADGLGFSCSITGRLQPSLEKFYEGIENELHRGLKLDYKKEPDLSYLAKQGVLLLNSALTVEQNKAGSHQQIWKPFTKFVLDQCLAYTGIPIVFIGKDAQQYMKYVTPLTHGHIFKCEHPAAAAKNSTDWNTEGVFTKVNTIIKQNNNYKISWLEEIPF